MRYASRSRPRTDGAFVAPHGQPRRRRLRRWGGRVGRERRPRRLPDAPACMDPAPGPDPQPELARRLRPCRRRLDPHGRRCFPRGHCAPTWSSATAPPMPPFAGEDRTPPPRLAGRSRAEALMRHNFAITSSIHTRSEVEFLAPAHAGGEVVTGDAAWPFTSAGAAPTSSSTASCAAPTAATSRACATPPSSMPRQVFHDRLHRRLPPLLRRRPPPRPARRRRPPPRGRHLEAPRRRGRSRLGHPRPRRPHLPLAGLLRGRLPRRGLDHAPAPRHLLPRPVGARPRGERRRPSSPASRTPPTSGSSAACPSSRGTARSSPAGASS